LNSSNGYQLPNGNYVSFSGGGGGGAAGDSSLPQGACPGNGVGGSFGYGGDGLIIWPKINTSAGVQYPPVNNTNGIDAVLYGAGGGGGSEGTGGDGASGIVMLIYN
jgi:hypothetical protein